MLRNGARYAKALWWEGVGGQHVSTVGGWPWGQIGGTPSADTRFRGSWPSRTSHSQTPRDQKKLQEAASGT